MILLNSTELRNARRMAQAKGAQTKRARRMVANG